MDNLVGSQNVRASNSTTMGMNPGQLKLNPNLVGNNGQANPGGYSVMEAH